MENNKQFIRTDIAKLSKSPAIVSLSECPNYVEFSNNNEAKEPAGYIYQKKEWIWQVVGHNYDGLIRRDTFKISEWKTRTIYTFHSSHIIHEITYDEEKREIHYPVYTSDKNKSASSLSDALNKVQFLRDNFDIRAVNNFVIFQNKTTSNHHAFSVEESSPNFSRHLKLESKNPYLNPQRDLNGFLKIEVFKYDIESHYIPAPEASEKQQKIDLEKFISHNSTIYFKDLNTLAEYKFSGTKNKEHISTSTFFLSEDTAITAQNIKECLMSNNFVSSNFNVDIIYNKMSNKFGNLIKLTALDINNIQNSTISSVNEDYIYAIGNIIKDDNDSIFNGSSNAAIEIETYTNTGSLLGENIFPENSMGTYMTTLRKSYHGKPLWFDLNALIANRNTYSSHFLDTNSWCDAGTVADYRFIARRFDGTNREPFYISDVLYSITGYDRNLNDSQIEKYIYNTELNNKISPLTSKLLFTHIPNQTQYFNFILADKNRKKGKEKDISLIYRLYSQSNRLIYDGLDEEKHKRHLVSREELAVVNTIKLDIDSVIEDYKNRVGFSAKEVGYVEVTLCHTINKSGREEEKESEKITFQILPACLHKVNDFAFLNALGGWSSFNFGGDQKTDFKASPTSIFKTQTPHYKTSDEIESVYSQDIKEQFSVKTTPINLETVEWLKEMSASKAVYELSTNRYVIVDEMNIQPNSKDELFTVEMKYRYSDSFNGRVQ